jgi:hypothetical protein
MENQRKELVPDPAILIKGLRDTGYDFNTALADIVDNSVDAEASFVDIRLRLNTNTPLPVNVMIADNGCGMDEEALLNGMMYGSTSLGKKSKRLGKFGLGLKTASTAFCKRLSVISRTTASAPYVMATWDLDIVAKDNKWDLLITYEENIPIEYKKVLNSVAKDGHGTLVIWEKIDRLQYSKQAQLTNAVGSLEKHLTMIFNRFLDKSFKETRNIEMRLNGRNLEAWDPFCKSEPETVENAQNDKSVSIIEESGVTTQASFHLTAYTLPAKDSFSSEQAKKNARLTNSNMGFYVYRENRMIAYGNWLGLRQNDPHETLSRIEFSFDQRLDAAFMIDVKKSQITLNPELADWLYKWSQPHVKFADQRYRKNQVEGTTKTVSEIHQKPDNNITQNEKSTITSKVTQASEIDPKTREQKVTIENGKTTTPFTVTIIVPDDEQSGVTIFPKHGLDDGVLWEPTFKNNHHAVFINVDHPFYQKIYCPNHKNGVVMDGLDSLLWALAEAENSVKYNQEMQENYQDLRIEVSTKLKKLVADLPDPEV